MIEFFTWLGVVWAKEVVKGASHAVIDKLRAPELEHAIDAELKAWEKDVRAQYAPGIQPGVLAHIFAAPHSAYDVPQSHMVLSSICRKPTFRPRKSGWKRSWQVGRK